MKHLLMILFVIASAGLLAVGYLALRSPEPLGPASRGYLGVVLSFEPAARAHVNRLGIRYVFRVLEVIPGSPAESAGIQPRDVIIRLDGSPVPFPDETTPLGSSWRPGQIVRFDIIRAGELEEREFSIDIPLMDHDEYRRLVDRMAKP